MRDVFRKKKREREKKKKNQPYKQKKILRRQLPQWAPRSSLRLHSGKVIKFHNVRTLSVSQS